MTTPSRFAFPSRRAILGAAAALPLLPASARAASAQEPALPSNPLVERRADPQIFRHDDGLYYMTASVPEYDRIVLRRAGTIAGLASADEKILWRHQDSGPLSAFLWAPELHRIDGRWHIYVAASPNSGDRFRIRTHVLVCDGDDPMTGGWRVLGQLQTPWDSFNLDSTIFVHRGVRYIAWAQAEPGVPTNSNLYLAPLASPLTLGAKPARLSIPTYDWETRGFRVNEAPALLHRNGRVFLTYSASATDARYCIGMLTAAEDADIMDPRSWRKSPAPVFASSADTMVFGPGHNSFTVDEQGRDILVYHGRDYERIEGDPLFNPDRHTRVQRIYYTADGTPDFGAPVGKGPLPQRFVSASDPARLLAHEGDRLLAGNPALAQTLFRQSPGRAGARSLMLSPILKPGHYLVAGKDGALTLQPDQPGADFAFRSQFVRFDDTREGTARFAAIAAPGKAVGLSGDRILLVPSRSAAARWRLD